MELNMELYIINILIYIIIKQNLLQLHIVFHILVNIYKIVKFFKSVQTINCTLFIKKYL